MNKLIHIVNREILIYFMRVQLKKEKI